MGSAITTWALWLAGLAVVGLVYAAYKWGRKAERNIGLERLNEVQRQADAFRDGLRDLATDRLDDRLRAARARQDRRKSG